MSAYDMVFSDNIYGSEEGGRYVSESRCLKMLDHEYNLLEERLVQEEYKDRRFFVCQYGNHTTTREATSLMGGWVYAFNKSRIVRRAISLCMSAYMTTT